MWAGSGEVGKVAKKRRYVVSFLKDETSPIWNAVYGNAYDCETYCA